MKKEEIKRQLHRRALKLQTKLIVEVRCSRFGNAFPLLEELELLVTIMKELEYITEKEYIEYVECDSHNSSMIFDSMIKARGNEGK